MCVCVCVCARIQSHLKVWDQSDLLCFLKKFLLLIKAVTIWSNIQKKNYYFLKYYCTLKLQFSILMYFFLLFIPVIKTFSIITPVVSVTWSFRNHSYMLIYKQRWKLMCCFIFFGGPVIFFFRIIWLIKSFFLFLFFKKLILLFRRDVLKE